MAEPVVLARGVRRSYRVGGQRVGALDGVELDVAPGEVVAVVGPSGSGKSTLLYLLGGLEEPDAGEIRVAGVDWATLRGRARARFRRRACGFVAQGLSLLPQATAFENVEIPLLLAGGDPAARRARAEAALERVDLTAHAAKLPDQLSGGQQQRVAIARALAAEPAVILADEPTAQLDSASATTVTELLVAVAAEHGTAVVLVTHDPAVARHAHRVLALRDGRLSAPVASGGGA
jgi:putative ABC transport system ATP-binding protein